MHAEAWSDHKRFGYTEHPQTLADRKIAALSGSGSSWPGKSCQRCEFRKLEGMQNWYAYRLKIFDVFGVFSKIFCLWYACVHETGQVFRGLDLVQGIVNIVDRICWG
jgi:hypothetical protein